MSYGTWERAEGIWETEHPQSHMGRQLPCFEGVYSLGADGVPGELYFEAFAIDEHMVLVVKFCVKAELTNQRLDARGRVEMLRVQHAHLRRVFEALHG